MGSRIPIGWVAELIDYSLRIPSYIYPPLVIAFGFNSPGYMPGLGKMGFPTIHEHKLYGCTIHYCRNTRHGITQSRGLGIIEVSPR